jgi:uncharacterized phage-associated protein
MKFAYDEGKAGEMAAFLLNWGDDPMGQMKLIKLLYIADRQAIVETGFSITGDQIYGMEKGPVLSVTLNLIKGLQRGRGKVASYVAPVSEKQYVRSVQHPPDAPELLSDYELRVLRRVHDEFGNHTGEQLKDWLHQNAPEWKEPNTPGGRALIDPADILAAEGWSPEAIAAIAAEADYYYGIEPSTGRTASA